MDGSEKQSWSEQAENWSAYIAKMLCNTFFREEHLSLFNNEYHGTLDNYFYDSILEAYTTAYAIGKRTTRWVDNFPQEEAIYENWGTKKKLEEIYLDFTQESSNSAFRQLLNEMLRTDEGIEFINTLPDRFKKIFENMSNCQTISKGFSLKVCKECSSIYFAGCNGCNDSHCCTCAGNKTKEKSIELIQSMYNCPYFMLTFTLPHELNELLDNRDEEIYAEYLNAYIKSIEETIKEVCTTYKHKKIGKPLGVPDIIEFLHTWDQAMQKHIHLHVLVSTIGYDLETKEVNELKPSSSGKYFLAPSDQISDCYKNKVIKKFRAISEKHSRLNKFEEIYKKIKSKKFNINCQTPDKQTTNAVLYLAAYANKVGLSPARIKKASDNIVHFARKRTPNGVDPENYDLNDLKNCIKIGIIEFFERFSFHILPKQFKRQRRTGLSKYHQRCPGEFKIKEELKPNQKSKDEIRLILDRYQEKLKKQLNTTSLDPTPNINNNFKIKECNNCQSKNLIHVSFNPIGEIKNSSEELDEKIKQKVTVYGFITANIIQILKKNKLLNIHLISPLNRAKEIENKN